jgi:hypothetical protein
MNKKFAQPLRKTAYLTSQSGSEAFFSEDWSALLFCYTDMF